ncbi:MAG: beta-lactamase family protein [Chloroflexi bacterium]|nr:beta-lactamase family protein [Chloroflexota bacterium]
MDGRRRTVDAGRADEANLLTAIASITKLYTAALTLDLAHDGALSLDDPLERWLPDAPNAGGVTIRQLLTHTSGLASDDPALAPVCDPGTCYSYSNSAFNYLGHVIEKATGQD